jgi:hypothetical protein
MVITPTLTPNCYCTAQSSAINSVASVWVAGVARFSSNWELPVRISVTNKALYVAFNNFWVLQPGCSWLAALIFHDHSNKAVGVLACVYLMTRLQLRVGVRIFISGLRHTA